MRDDILACIGRYETDTNGRITDPGKFEGSSIFVPWYWQCVLDGDGEPIGEDEDDNTVVFDVTHEERALFSEWLPWFDDAKRVVVGSDDNGFVYSEVLFEENES